MNNYDQVDSSKKIEIVQISNEKTNSREKLSTDKRKALKVYKQILFVGAVNCLIEYKEFKHQKLGYSKSLYSKNLINDIGNACVFTERLPFNDKYAGQGEKYLSVNGIFLLLKNNEWATALKIFHTCFPDLALGFKKEAISDVESRLLCVNEERIFWSYFPCILKRKREVGDTSDIFNEILDKETEDDFILNSFKKKIYNLIKK